MNASIADELVKLKALLEDGTISEEEFAQLKQKIISDAAPENEALYKFVLAKRNIARCTESNQLVAQIMDISIETARDLSQSLPLELITGITEEECIRLQSEFDKIKCETTFVLDEPTAHKNTSLSGKTIAVPRTSVIKERTPEEIRQCQEQKEKDAQQVKCPKCGSTSISTGMRGWKWTTGFLGSSKTVNRCEKCGNTWYPNTR